MSDATIEDGLEKSEDDGRIDGGRAAAAHSAMADAKGDERLAYQGVFQRLLIRPEIGAAIAAIAIWVFFWAVSVPFGLTGGTASILDVSATLGIMAVAVSMLMIGGEFDLSAGAATGALGIVTILLVRDVAGDIGGAGFSLWVALPISLLVALGIGWFNGTMVNRTSLPSFIVTLGSFFILKGVKLGFAKLIVDQIQVGKMDDLAIYAEETGGSDRGYAFFDKIFAAEWPRNEHTFDARDTVYSVAMFLGLSLLVLAIYELHFKRRQGTNAAGVLPLAAGIAGGIAGVFYLHNTDGGGDFVGSAIIGISMLVGFFGLAMWRYEPRADRGSFGLNSSVIQALVAGLVALVGAVVAAVSFDASSEEDVFFLVTEQGLRAILFVCLAAAAAVFLLIGVHRAGRISQTSRSAMLFLTALAVAGTAFFIQSESQSPKFRAQVFSIMLAISALMGVWSIVSLFFSERRSTDASADRVGTIIGIVGAISMIIGLVVRLLFVVEEELAAGIPPSKFSVRILWFLLFTAVCTWVLGRTKFGSWTFAVGGNKDAARQVGVPAGRTKTQLFMLVSFAAWLVGVLLAFRLNTIQASTGDGLEFEYIIAAVVGGTMLTGGYGSAFGASIGAIIMAMAVQGIPSSRWNSDWRFVFLGTILLTAVIANNFIRSKAEAAR